MGEIDFFNAR